MPESATFQIAYDGPGLVNNSMDVTMLAPALLAFGDLFNQANQLMNGDRAKVRLHVKAHTPGSYNIFFEVIQSFPGQIVDFLSGDFVTSALNLKELIFAGGISLWWLIKKLKGKNPDSIEKLGPGMIRIQVDGEAYDVPLELLDLYRDISVRTAVSKIVHPLSYTDVERLEIKENGRVTNYVIKSDLPYFGEPTIKEETITDSERRATFSIISLAFKDDNKWRLFDGAITYPVTVKDQNFLDKVNRNQISFAKGDVLVCRMKTTQKQTSTGLKANYELLEVIEHKPAQRQLFLLPTDVPQEYLPITRPQY